VEMIRLNGVFRAWRCLLLLALMCWGISDCANIGSGVSGDGQLSERKRHIVDGHIELLINGFFPPDIYWSKYEGKRQLFIQLTGSDRLFMNSRTLRTAMTEEIEKGNVSFLDVMFFLSPGVEVVAQEGAFILTMAFGDTIREFRDLGLCMNLNNTLLAEKPRPIYDTGIRPFLVKEQMQKSRPKGRPLVGSLRFPAEASRGKLKGIRIDYEKWRYNGPGVKEKPQLK